MYIIFRVLLSFIHFVYNLYYFIQQQYTKFVLLIDQCRYSNKIKCNYSLLKSNEHLIKVLKIPRHLAILLGHEEVSVFDLAKLISWCVAAEIPCVTFYDHKGNLQRNRVSIKEKLEELEPNVMKNIEWPSTSGKPTNGVKRVDEANKDIYPRFINSEVKDISKHKTKVYFLSYTDCKGKIVTLTKSLAKPNDSSNFQEEDITPEFLDKKLIIGNETPNPELAIVFGKTMCTYGFMPWQARVTEFFMIPTHHNISADSFMKVFTKYSKCQQRYGK